jgi:hypothetical protein
MLLEATSAIQAQQVYAALFYHAPIIVRIPGIMDVMPTPAQRIP